MKKTFSIFLIIIGIHLFASLAFSQNPAPTPRQRPRPFRSGTGEGSENSNRSLQTAPQNGNEGEEAIPNLRPLSAIRKELREKLKLSDSEKESYKRLAGDKKANIVRVITAFSCSSSLVIDLSDPRCSDNPDLSLVSYYSFRFKDYGESPWMDISFIEDDLTAGNKWHTLGFITDLGETADFGKLDAKSEEVKTLWTYREPKTIEEKIKEKEDLEKGFIAGKLNVSEKIKSQLNHTYIVRTISYRMDGFRAFGMGFSWHNTDSLFVFKILEVSEDRVVTLAWKRLYQKIAPILEDKKDNDDK